MLLASSEQRSAPARSVTLSCIRLFVTPWTVAHQGAEVRDALKYSTVHTTVPAPNKNDLTPNVNSAEVRLRTPA